MGVEPSLAIRWSLVSPTVWQFDLRPGVTFHSGDPLTAEDIVFSLARASTGTSAWKSDLLGIANVEAPDPHTVVVTTRAPDLILPLDCAHVTRGCLPASTRRCWPGSGSRSTCG